MDVSVLWTEPNNLNSHRPIDIGGLRGYSYVMRRFRQRPISLLENLGRVVNDNVIDPFSNVVRAKGKDPTKAV